MAMGISRMLDQNVYFWLVSGLRHGIPGELAEQDWSNVKIVAGFPNNVDRLTLPTAAVVKEGHTDVPLQLGSSTAVIRKDVFSVSTSNYFDIVQVLESVYLCKELHECSLHLTLA